MLDVRSAWFDGNYGPPPGNKRESTARAWPGLATWPALSCPASVALLSVKLRYRPAHVPSISASSLSLCCLCRRLILAHACPPTCAPRLAPAVPSERDQWQQPTDAFSISDRGKAQAAMELAKQLQERMRQRGCREEFVPNAELFEQGKVDFLPAAALTEEELERQRLLAVEACAGWLSAERRVLSAYARSPGARRCPFTRPCLPLALCRGAPHTRPPSHPPPSLPLPACPWHRLPCSTCTFEMDGKPATFDLIFKRVMPTNGGHMFDVVVTYQARRIRITKHSVCVCCMAPPCCVDCLVLCPRARLTACPTPAVARRVQDKETQHRVIVGRDYYEPLGIPPQVS